MGVDFLTCKVCKYNFPDCGPYFQCDDCWSPVCDGCAKEGKMGHYSDLPLETYIDEVTGEEVEYNDCDNRNCPFCKLEIISDSDLLLFAIDCLDTTREELEGRYRYEK